MKKMKKMKKKKKKKRERSVATKDEVLFAKRLAESLGEVKLQEFTSPCRRGSCCCCCHSQTTIPGTKDKQVQ